MAKNFSMEIINRLKELYEVNTDSALAECLEVNHATISTWKSRDSIDLRLIFKAIAMHPYVVDYNWLFRGVGLGDKSPVAAEKEIYRLNEIIIDRDLMIKALEEEQENFRSRINTLMAQIQILQDTLIKVQSSNSYQMSKVSNQEFHKNIAAEKLKGYK